MNSNKRIFIETLVYYLFLTDLFLGAGTVSRGWHGPPFETYLHRQWTDWTSWSSCSRTCGGGVRVRTRICSVRLVQHVVKVYNSCFGETTEYEMCGKRSCPANSDFLSYQCSRQNGQKISGRVIHQWLPFMNVKLPCELQCISQDRTVLYTFGKVIDGTNCKTSHGLASSGICVNGRCTNIDCTGQLGWVSQLDKCGVCRGDNSSCTHYRNTFWSRSRSTDKSPSKVDYHYDYSSIVEIPSHVTNLLIREYSEENFLAIMDENGSVLINGNWRVGSPGRFQGHQGLDFTYSRSFNGRESIFSAGPTDGSLLVLVLGKGDLPTVNYEYWIDKRRQQFYSKAHFKHHHPQYHLSNTTSVIEKAYHSDQLPQYENENRNPSIQGYKSYYHHNKILGDGRNFKFHGVGKINDSNKGKRVFGTTVGEEKSLRKNETLGNVKPLSAAAYATVVPPGKEFNQKYRYNFKNEKLSFGKPFSRELTLSKISDGSFGRPNGTAAFVKRRHGHAYVYNNNNSNNASHVHNNNTSQRRSRQADSSYPNHQVYTVDLKSDSLRKDPKRKFRKKRKGEKNANKKNCEPCNKVKKARNSYCSSDFVLRATVLASEKHGQEIRYEVEIIQSFKNTVTILAKEYIWSPERCRCPNLRIGREYVIMGRLDANKRESRLSIGRDSYVRRYTRHRARSIQKIVRDQKRIC